MSVSESADEYAETIVNKFIREITDQVFLYIENNDDLMREYMSNVNLHKLKEVNTSIGEKVRKLLDLANDGENNDPKSRLIKGYIMHKIKGDK